LEVFEVFGTLKNEKNAPSLNFLGHFERIAKSDIFHLLYKKKNIKKYPTERKGDG
jgi:hypothetical protein